MDGYWMEDMDIVEDMDRGFNTLGIASEAKIITAKIF